MISRQLKIIVTVCVCVFLLGMMVPQVHAGKTCASNPRCAKRGLKGNCCPTNAGVKLDCCARAPRKSPKVDPKLCSAHTKCAGLKGSCCPTTAGVYLKCCS